MRFVKPIMLILVLLFFGTTWIWAQDVKPSPSAQAKTKPKAASKAVAATKPGEKKTPQDFAASNPQDPFVRGLKRLDDRLKRQREVEKLNQQKKDVLSKTLELEKKRAAQAEEAAKAAKLAAERVAAGLDPLSSEGVARGLLSDPGFFTAFATRKYRLEGLVLSKPPSKPIIHLVKEPTKLPAGLFYWAGGERRWVYERKKGEPISKIARKFIMKSADLLAINGVARERQLSTPMRLYVSPRDNGSLIHIIVRGDTLAKMAKTYKTKVNRLRVRNDVVDVKNLKIGRRFLIREKTITDKLAAAPMPVDNADNRDSKARLAYARLGQYETKSAAMRNAREFFDKYMPFMDSDIILRHERDAAGSGRHFYNMDIGPLLSWAHGEAYCALFRRDEMPCQVVQRVPGAERVKNFDSQAIISLSPFAFYDSQDRLDSGRTDIGRLTKQEYFLTEGQSLGSNRGMIAKITAKQIYVTNARGFLITLPLDKLPEINPIEQLPKAAQLRQETINNPTIKAETAGGDKQEPRTANIPSAPDAKNKPAADKGSDSLIESFAKKPKKIDKKDVKKETSKNEKIEKKEK